MMRPICFILFLIITFSFLPADYLQTTFTEASEAYQRKDFHQALEMFRKLENENIVQADLFYNIGNCYFQLNQLGKAILYYKRSVKHNPGHEQAEKNLAYALTLTQDKQSYEQDEFLANLWNKLLRIFPLNTLAWILFILFTLIILLINIVIIRYRKREKTAPMFILLLLCFLFAFFSLLSITQWNRFSDDSKAVLLVSTEIGYSGPNEDFTRVFTIHVGMILDVERTDGEWSLIKLPNGVGGWIRTNSFERV